MSGETTVTEAEWLACTDPTPMLEFLQGKSSDRKLRLFAVGCCRRIWHLLTKQPKPFRHLVELSEQAADGLITDDPLWDAWPYTLLESGRWGKADRTRHAGLATLAATGISVRWGYQEAQQFAAAAATDQPCYYELDPTIPAVAVELEAQTNLLRCIIGNAFRPLPPKRGRKKWEQMWHCLQAWNDGTIPKLAQTIYEDRAFDRLPILADALEEAGCSNQVILGHCRSGGEHVRGCWVIDLVLGKS